MKYYIFSFFIATLQSISFAATPTQQTVIVEKKPVTCLWIGCSASSATAGQCLGLRSEQLCVHSNFANLCASNDPSVESTLRHALETEKVSQIVVCGTYGCPAVRSALLSDHPEGTWLHSVRALYVKNKNVLDKIQDENERINRLVELNVIEQVQNIRSHSIVQNVYNKKQPLTILGIAHNPQSTISRELVRFTTNCITTKQLD